MGGGMRPWGKGRMLSGGRGRVRLAQELSDVPPKAVGDNSHQPARAWADAIGGSPPSSGQEDERWEAPGV